MVLRRPEFVLVDDNGAQLAGLHYAPDGPPDTAILHLHGKGGNFYTGPGRRLAEADQDGQFGHLTMNMRCHDLGYTDYDVPMGDAKSGQVRVAGGMWEDLENGHLDIRAGVRWLISRGYSRVVLSGHSSGGFHVARYCADAANLAGGHVGARVFLSPVLTHRTHLFAGWFTDDDQLQQALAQARRAAAAGAGHRLIPTNYWYHAISADSLLQRYAEPPDAFEALLAACDLPLLLVGGSQELRLDEWRQLYHRSAVEQKDFTVLPDAEHNYIGAEPALFYRIATFIQGIGT